MTNPPNRIIQFTGHSETWWLDVDKITSVNFTEKVNLLDKPTPVSLTSTTYLVTLSYSSLKDDVVLYSQSNRVKAERLFAHLISCMIGFRDKKDEDLTGVEVLLRKPTEE